MLEDPVKLLWKEFVDRTEQRMGQQHGQALMKTSLGGVVKWATYEVQRWQLWSWQEILEVPPNVVAEGSLKKNLKTQKPKNLKKELQTQKCKNLKKKLKTQKP